MAASKVKPVPEKVRKSPHSGKPSGAGVGTELCYWNQEGFLLDVSETVCKLLNQKGITHHALSIRMGKSRYWLQKRLDSSVDWNIRDLSDVLTYLDCLPKLKVVKGNW